MNIPFNPPPHQLVSGWISGRKHRVLGFCRFSWFIYRALQQSNKLRYKCTCYRLNACHYFSLFIMFKSYATYLIRGCLRRKVAQLIISLKLAFVYIWLNYCFLIIWHCYMNNILQIIFFWKGKTKCLSLHQCVGLLCVILNRACR